MLHWLKIIISILFSTDHTHMFSHENAYFLINAFSSTTLKRLKALMGTKVHYAFSA